MWETVPWEELGVPKLDLTKVAHKPIQICKGRFPWQICQHCRLARLRNQPSEKAWGLGCNWLDILKSRGDKRGQG